MDLLEKSDLSVPTIPEFYKGKIIFITGGTGFMGKVLIEKLLYSCSELDRIYLLLRDKKGINSEARLQEIYSSACFERLKKEKPTIFKSKVSYIAGDVMKTGLGLSKTDRTLLVTTVNIVFHVAASVRFNDTLKYAVRINLKGTMEMVKLAKDMRNLSAFIHVSTAYSNTNRDLIEEIMYPPHADVEDTLTICENLDEHTLRVLTPKYLGEVPNTYAFSKQLAEHVVYETKGQLPAVIIRPSVVISCSEEPVPGWIDNFNGPTGLLVAGGMGILRCAYTDPDLAADYIPVDVSIKSMIVAAWMRGIKDITPMDDVSIYNCCASKLNTMTVGELMTNGIQMLPEVPLGTSLWYPSPHITKSKTVYYIQMILLHLIPAVIIDAILIILGRKPMLFKIQRRIYTACIALEHYTTKQWTFDNRNFILLRSCIKEEDLKSFYYEIEKVDKHKFYYNSMLGARRYLLKQKDEDFPKHRVHHRRMFILHRVVQFIFWGYVLYMFHNSSYIQSILTEISANAF